MDIQNQVGLSRKSRGILYQLKQQLTSRNISLKYHICDIFQFQKRQFKKKQFFMIIQKYDTKLMLSELDKLFDQLDESRNERVALSELQRVFSAINENDNPNIINQSQIIRSVSKRNSEKIADIIHIYAEIRKLMLKSEEVVEILHLFAHQNAGFISQDNINDILINLDYNNSNLQQVFLENILEGKQKIGLNQFLERLDLNESARRSSISIPSVSQIRSMRDLNQSLYIKEKLKKDIKIEGEDMLKLSTMKSISNDGNQYIDLQNIPEILTPYYNYGSELQPIFAHVARQYIQTKSVFIDGQNPPYSLAHQWIHLAQNEQNYVLFQKASSVIHRQNRKGLGQLLEPKDIIQGNLGDCYLLCAIVGIVQKYPELVYRLYVLEKNPSHIYGVRLFIEGSWRTIILDSCFPIDRHRRFCAAQPYNNQIWVMLLQKAWAKVYGSYDNIHAGYNDEGLNALSGAPSIHVSAQENQFIKRLQVQINRGSVITIATSPYVSQLSKHEQDGLGIFQNHAYSILNVYSGFKGRDNEELTLIKIRNPWGRKQWQGKWNYKSQLWTKQLRERLNYIHDPKDGSFFMNKQDFSIYFNHVNICRVNLAYKNSWIQVESDRQEFKSMRINVKERGDYYFTLYQENPRRYAGKNYEKSKSWIFLYEYRDGRVNAIGSSSKINRDNTLELTLQKGEYIIISKIQWRLWESHRYTLASYGPERVSFKLQPFNIHDISNFIESKAKLGFGKKSFYDNANILKRLLFSADQGYGFILINNQQNRVFQTQIRFVSHKGLNILEPYSLPIKLQIYPGQEIICKFIVDPSGYAYSLKQNYHYVNAK